MSDEVDAAQQVGDIISPQSPGFLKRRFKVYEMQQLEDEQGNEGMEERHGHHDGDDTIPDVDIQRSEGAGVGARVAPLSRRRSSSMMSGGGGGTPDNSKPGFNTLISMQQQSDNVVGEVIDGDDDGQLELELGKQLAIHVRNAVLIKTQLDMLKEALEEVAARPPARRRGRPPNSSRGDNTVLRKRRKRKQTVPRQRGAEECFECGDTADDWDDSVQCCVCQEKWHLACATPELDEKPDARWLCKVCARNARTLFCAKCHVVDDEEQIFCDGCDDLYHLTCLKLPRVPEGTWFCQKCQVASGTRRKRGRPRKNPVSTATASTSTGRRRGRPRKTPVAPPTPEVLPSIPVGIYARLSTAIIPSTNEVVAALMRSRIQAAKVPIPLSLDHIDTIDTLATPIVDVIPPPPSPPLIPILE